MPTKSVKTKKHIATFEKWAPMHVKNVFLLTTSKIKPKVAPKWFQNGAKSGPKTNLELRGETLGSKMRPSVFWALSRGKRPLQITHFFAPRESSFISLEVCFAQKVDFAGRLFAIHFLGVFRADFGASAPVKMWFWYGRCYENILFQIANILAIEGSIFNVFREPNLAKTRKGPPLMSSSKSKRKSESILFFCFVSGKIVIRAPPPCGPLKTVKSEEKKQWAQTRCTC